jgi:polyisoprenoid-binding protein YceI
MKITLFALLVFCVTSPGAQKLVMNDETTTVGFVTKFLGGRLEGTFKGVDGSADFNPTQLNNSYLKLVFSTATATTSDNTAGPNFIQPECLYPAKYPFIELFSTSITKGGGVNDYNFNGQLKIKGTTKNIAIPFTAVPNVGGYDFNFGFGFKRKDFGLKCTGLGKEFKVTVRSYAKKAQPL